MMKRQEELSFYILWVHSKVVAVLPTLQYFLPFFSAFPPRYPSIRDLFRTVELLRHGQVGFYGLQAFSI